MKKVFFLILFVLILVVGLIGCSQKKEPLEVLNKYFDNIKNNNFDMNYDYLSSASKNIWTKENYKKWESIYQQAFPFKEAKIEKTNEYNDKELDGIKYKNVFECRVTEINHVNYYDKDINSDHILYVVNENGQWKIYRGKEDPKELISEAEVALAGMYETGKGTKKDLDKAKNILEESIKENSDYSASYHFLSILYNELQRQDDAIKCEEQYVEKATTNKDKARGYFTLGRFHEEKKDYSNAKEYYTKAIETDSSNEDAKNSLRVLNLKPE